MRVGGGSRWRSRAWEKHKGRQKKTRWEWVVDRGGEAAAWEEETSFRNSDFKDRPEFNSCSLEFRLGVSASALHAGGNLGLGWLGYSLAHVFPFQVLWAAILTEELTEELTELLCSWPEWEASLISPGIRIEGEKLGSDSLVCKIEFVVSTAVTINHLGRNVQLMEQSLLVCAC